eukprot:TRINITY_DN1128_c0_g1_i1.p1 TRINITY_DN1128_c0_g1~~TRINITY_DN1128_c0_g1_i1.p1  ORF type:complete len:137 (-),score=42.26 TRINITY_DN1128_c0_g1_i1:13-423(-)
MNAPPMMFDANGMPIVNNEQQHFYRIPYPQVHEIQLTRLYQMQNDSIVFEEEQQNAAFEQQPARGRDVGFDNFEDIEDLFSSNPAPQTSTQEFGGTSIYDMAGELNMPIDLDGDINGGNQSTATFDSSDLMDLEIL